jgi:predicted SAM-dependent methyltransferase
VTEETMGASEMVKINFGAGYKSVPGWINYDIALRHIVVSRVPGAATLLYRLGLLKKPGYEAHLKGSMKLLRYGDVRKRLRHKDNSVDVVYAEHALEHLTYDDAHHFVRELYRVLRFGGLVRIAVPDLEREARRYLSMKAEDHDTVENTERFVEVFFSRSAREFRKYGHRWMYDEVTLRALLKGAHFRTVVRESFKHGQCPDVEELEIRRDSLVLEAVK